jgi:hypothetical protein
MESFGHRRQMPFATVAPRQAWWDAASSAHRLAGIGILAGLAALTSMHVWINILHVPWERPMGALFNGGPAIREGWAAWFVAPSFAAAFTLALLAFYFRRSRRWTVPATAIAGLLAVVFGAWAAYWVKNIGYTWYFVPGASVQAILGVQPQMAALAFGRAAYLLVQQPLLPAIGAVGGLLVGLVLRAPLRAAESVAPADNIALHAKAARTSPQAGWAARLITTVLMSALAGAVASTGIPLVGIVVAPIAGLIWYFISFRDGHYGFMNVLIGSTAVAVLVGLPLALMTMRPSFGPGLAVAGAGGGLDWRFLVTGAAVRLPILVLLSIACIKITLLLSRALTQPRGRAVLPS